MKIQISEKEADKIIQHKISALQKLKKPIKTDSKGKFFEEIFKRLNLVRDICAEDSDYFKDNSILTFYLSIYTNVNLCIHASTLSGFQYSIYEYVESEGILLSNGDREEITSIDDLKKYFEEFETYLPQLIESNSINFEAVYNKSTIKYSYNK